MDFLNDLIKTLCDLLWNFPMLILLLGTHLYFTVRLGFIQKKLPRGIRMSFQKNAGHQGVSAYEALSTALAATIGTGNIIGISTAIALGGPGALFWCWISGVLGMATCYAECFLSARYRLKRPDGSRYGGPMYVMEHVLHKKWLAVLFAFFAVMAALSAGSSVQAHSLTVAVTGQIPISPHPVGIVVALLAGRKRPGCVPTWFRS